MKTCTLNLPRFGSGIGLHRVYNAARPLGIRLENFADKSIVVTGTNGKGTVAKSLAEIARHCGRSTALFTSPHVFEFNERFCINGTSVSDEQLRRSAATVGELIGRYESKNPEDKFGEFEAWFLQALVMFEEQEVEFCVFEAGIGGRYDPTRLIRPRLSCITSIDLEHTKLLGNTVDEIILDKLDIAPPGSKVLMGRGLSSHNARVNTVSWVKQVEPIWNREIFESVESDLIDHQSRIKIAWKDGAQSAFHTSMRGRFAADNIALSCALYRLFFGERHFRESEPSIARALNGLRWPGRFELLSGEREFLIDFGHTPRAIDGTLADLENIFDGIPKVFLVGVSKGREQSGIIEKIANIGSDFIIGEAHKGMRSEEIESIIKSTNSASNVVAFKDPHEAYLAAIEMSKRKNSMICVIGGFFWGATIRALIENRSLDSIDFS